MTNPSALCLGVGIGRPAAPQPRRHPNGRQPDRPGRVTGQRQASIEIVQMFEPKEINLVVAGGGAQGAWKMFGARYERTISIDAWR